MVIVGFYKEFNDNKICLVNCMTLKEEFIFVDSNDFSDELFDVLCKIEEKQIIRIEFEQRGCNKYLQKMYFLK